jgi:hypothetical protein
MKTILFATILFFGSGQSSVKEPPIKIMKAFNQKFPSAMNIQWIEKDNRIEGTRNIMGKIQKFVQDDENTWKVNFKLKDKRAAATFTLDGHWLWSELEKSLDDTREEVRSAIKRDYPSCEVLSIYIQEYVGRGSVYKIKIKCGDMIEDVYYDHNGWPPPRF